MIDYHLHTARCGHARGTMAEYVAMAAARGLREVGFADHFPLGLLGYTPQKKVSMEPEEWPEYMAQVQALGAAGGAVTVKLGTEVDYLPGRSRFTAELLRGYPLDYVIGSVHFIGGWDFSHPAQVEEYRRRDLSAIYDAYFTLVWEAIAAGFCDIIGHADVIKKFGFRLSDEVMEPYWRRTAALLAEHGVCLELNTAGLDAPVGECYPGERLLELCAEAGVPVTLGSDAHAPGQVGRHFQVAVAALRRVGYCEVARFVQRQRTTVPLPGVPDTDLEAGAAAKRDAGAGPAGR